MVDEEKLEIYCKKYDEIKEKVVEASIVKSELVRQQKLSDAKMLQLSNDIKIRKTNLSYNFVKDKAATTKKLKDKLANQILKNGLFGVVLFILCCFLKLPFILSIPITSLITFVQSIIDLREYFESSKKLKVETNYKVNNLETKEIAKLLEELNKEIDKNLDIKESLSVVNIILADQAEIKLDIENLIICLFSNLDNIIKNKCNQKEPFATWLNINYEETEPKLEISSTLKRTKNKKESK